MTRKRVNKLVIAGLGLALLAIIVSSMGRDFAFTAGIIFVGVIILGIVGIIKMRKHN
jgi:uncharacterized membrane protein